MDSQIIVTVIGVISSGITGLFGWFIGKRKRNIETDGAQIDNIAKQVEVYKDLVQDLQQQLQGYISDNHEIRSDLIKLRKTVGRIVVDVCLTKNCSERTYLKDQTINQLLQGNNDYQEEDKSVK